MLFGGKSEVHIRKISQAVLANPKTTVGDNRYHEGGYQLFLLSHTFYVRLCARSHNNGDFTCHVTLLLHK